MKKISFIDIKSCFVVIFASFRINTMIEFTDNNFSIGELSPSQTPDFPIILKSVVLALCTNGSGNIQLNFESYNISERDIIVMYPQSFLLFNHKDASSDFRIKYISFTLEFISEFDSSYLNSVETIFKTNDEEYNKLMDIYSVLERKYNSQDEIYKKEIVRYTLLASTYEFCAILERRGVNSLQIPQHKDNILKDFFNLLVEYHTTSRKIEFYADKLHITSQYLSTIIKKWTNKTVLEWIHESIILSTKIRLRTSDLTIQGIAEYTGYPDATSFIKFFKKHVGVTPKEYRNEVLKKQF